MRNLLAENRNPMVVWIGFAIVAVALLVLPFALAAVGTAWVRITNLAILYVFLALGLNIVVGFAGLLDLGYIAFYAVGAYVYALLASPHFNLHLPFWIILPIGAAVACFFGVLLGTPTLKLRGDYLAIVTLGFGEIIRIFLNNLSQPVNITNGPQGISLIDPFRIGDWSFAKPETFMGLDFTGPVKYYYFFLVMMVIVIVINIRLQDSRIGRAWEAIREDEIAAQAMGVPLVRAKLLAFACGASFAGVMGVVFAAKQVFINPESFTFLESIGVLAMVILGGMGSIPGAILGATVVTVLNLQVLKGLSLWLNELKNAGVVVLGYNLGNLPTQLEPAKYERMVFGVILVLMTVFRPQGFLPARRRERELR